MVGATAPVLEGSAKSNNRGYFYDSEDQVYGANGWIHYRSEAVTPADDQEALREQLRSLEAEYEGLEATTASLRRSTNLPWVRRRVLTTAVIVAPLILAAGYVIYWYFVRSSWFL